jgi:hypothetical protein
MLTLTPDAAAALTADGSVWVAVTGLLLEFDPPKPPAEIVEALIECDECGGDGDAGDGGEYLTCPDCHHGKRVIQVQVVCDYCRGVGHCGPGTHARPQDYGRSCPFCDGEGTILASVTVAECLPIVQYSEWEIGGAHAECVALDDYDQAVYLSERETDDGAVWGKPITLYGNPTPGQFAIQLESVKP